MAINASRPAPRQRFGQEYAANIAASFDPRIGYYTRQKAALRRPEEVEQDITRLYTPAIEAAGRIGEDVSKVGSGAMAALGGLASSLPGFMAGGLEDAARSTSRAGGSAALLGSVMGTGARSQLASSILQGRRALEGEERALGEQIMTAEEEKARTAADYLPYAQQRQAMETTALSNQQIRAELKNAPISRRAALLQNMLASGQITAQNLSNAQLRKELKRLGLSDRAINKAAQTTPTSTQTGQSVG